MQEQEQKQEHEQGLAEQKGKDQGQETTTAQSPLSEALTKPTIPPLDTQPHRHPRQQHPSPSDGLSRLSSRSSARPSPSRSALRPSTAPSPSASRGPREGEGKDATELGRGGSLGHRTSRAALTSRSTKSVSFRLDGGEVGGRSSTSVSGGGRGAGSVGGGVDGTSARSGPPSALASARSQGSMGGLGAITEWDSSSQDDSDSSGPDFGTKEVTPPPSPLRGVVAVNVLHAAFCFCFCFTSAILRLTTLCVGCACIFVECLPTFRATPTCGWLLRWRDFELVMRKRQPQLLMSSRVWQVLTWKAFMRGT